MYWLSMVVEVPGPAFGQREDQVEGLEAVDDQHHQHVEVAGGQHGQRDGLELLPLGGAVDAGGFYRL